MPNGKDYDRGVRDGATESTVEGLGKSVSEIWGKLDVLPCGKVSAEVAAITASVKRQWVLLIALFTSQAAIIALIIKLLDLTIKK